MKKRLAFFLNPIFVIICQFLVYNAIGQGYAFRLQSNSNFGTAYVLNGNTPLAGLNSVTVQAASSSTQFIVEWNSYNDKWSNLNAPKNQEMTLFWGNSASANSVLTGGFTLNKHYTLQIRGNAYSNRPSIIMETDNAPRNFAASSPVSGPSIVCPNAPATITINLAGAKSSQERVFVRYSSTSNFSSSKVVEATGTGATWSTASATIPGADNSSGTIYYYAYSTTAGATNSSDHDLITLRLGNNGGSNYSYTIVNSPAPTLAVTNNCNGTSTLTVSGATGSLIWSGPSTPTGSGNTYTVTTGGSYSVTQTINGCVSGSSNAVTAAPRTTPEIPSLSITNNCGNSVITANGITGTLIWSDGGSGNPRTVTSGSYTVTQSSNGCTSGTSNSVTAAPLLIPSAPTLTIANTCQGISTLTASNFTGTLIWSDNGSGNPRTVTAPSGPFTVTQTASNGCTSPASNAVNTVVVDPGTFAVSSNFGEFASAAYFNTTYYNTRTLTGPDAIGSTNYNNANLGSFNANSGALVFKGGQIKTFKNGNGNVCVGLIKYRVYPSGTAEGSRPAFSSSPLNFVANCNTSNSLFADGFGRCNAGDQKWQSSLTQDLTARCPGNYEVELFYEITGSNTNTSGCDITLYDNNCTNYKASFTINPISVVETQTSVCSYTWNVNNTTYSESGTYSATRTNVYGCLETVTLNLTITPCPVDCVVSAWGEWSAWSTEACGAEATRTRTRTVVTPASNGGTACPVLEETETRINAQTTEQVSATACDAYTWALNGQTYTNSGQYTFTSGCNTTLLNLTINRSTVIVSANAPIGVIYRAIEARWKGFNNTSGVNSALYLGNNNMASGGINRVETGRNGLYIKPGETNVSFSYNKTSNSLIATVGSRTVTYTSVSTKATGNMNILNFMHIFLRSGSGTNTGVAEFKDVVLNGQSLGSFVAPAAAARDWTISNVDFSQGFTLTGKIKLDAGTYGSNESSKLDIWVGNNNSALPCVNESFITSVSQSPEQISLPSLKSAKNESESLATDLEVKLYNNPAIGSSPFRIQILSNDLVHPINVRIIDASGKPQETRQNLTHGSTIEFGRNYNKGLYIVEAVQSGRRTIAKVLKQ